MNFPRFILLLPFLAAAALAQQPIGVEIVGEAANHELNWSTTLNFNYQVEASPDLVTWLDTGIAEPGTGSTIAYGLMSTADKMFYRIKETADPYNGGFLILPTHNQEMDLVDGVIFAFNLNVFTEFPDRIRLYRREYGSGDPWEQIGRITEFMERDGVKFVRGSAVWLPDAEGEYEIQAVVVDDTDTVIASAVRRVIVGSNQPPVIEITDGPATPSASFQPAEFTTTVSDPDGDDIRRVEFYDNGILIGTDREAPFGDEIRDMQDWGYDLLRGTHDITAKAYDSKGSVSETTGAFQVVVTGGNARPAIGVNSPASGLIVTQGQSFTISYTASDPDGSSNLREVAAVDVSSGTTVASDSSAPFTDLTVSTAGWEPGTHTIKVFSRDASFAWSYPHYFKVFVRTGSGPGFAETLVANIVDETTAAPSAEVFTGVQASSAEFEGGFDAGLQIDEGIVLTSGLASLWNNGDTLGNSDERVVETFANHVESGDLDLENRIVGVRTTDAASLEFDVFCSNAQLELDFQFGSEEYDEYVGQFNDGFMVSVTRQGATAGTVVSLLPDGSDIIAVNTVSQMSNYNQNEHLFLDDDDDIKPTVAPEHEDHRVEYDGMTVRLRAHTFVTPNSVYRIKIVVADTDGYGSNDDILDSGVFVGMSSVRTVSTDP